MLTAVVRVFHVRADTALSAIRVNARTRTTGSRAVREEGVRSNARRVGGYYVVQFVAGAAMQLAVRIGLLVGWALPPAGSIVIAISLVRDPSKSTTVVA